MTQIKVYLSATGERERTEQDTGAESLQELQGEENSKEGGVTEQHRKGNSLVILVNVIFLKLPNQSVN